MGNLSFSPASSQASSPAFEPVPENSHGQQQTDPGHFSDNVAGVEVFGKKVVADVIADEHEQEETDQDDNNPANYPSECTDGARFVVLAQVECCQIVKETTCRMMYDH